jgi:hypothetical protein
VLVCIILCTKEKHLSRIFIEHYGLLYVAFVFVLRALFRTHERITIGSTHNTAISITQ